MMIHLRTYEHRFWGRTPARYGRQRGARGSGAVVNRRARQRRPVFSLPRDSIVFFSLLD